MKKLDYVYEASHEYQSVLEVLPTGESLEIRIGTRFDWRLFLSIPVAVLFVLYLMAHALLTGRDDEAILAAFSAAFVFSVTLGPWLRLEWLASRPWTLNLEPEGWQLSRGEKVMAKGQHPPEVLVSAKLNEMDPHSRGNQPLRLKSANSTSPKFGYSLNATEIRALIDGVESYYGST